MEVAAGHERPAAGAPRVLTTGLGLTEASFSADGTRLAYCQGTRHFGSANLWRVLIPENGVATDADGVQLTFDDAGIGSCDISPDGTHLLFNSDRAGEQDIWILPAEGGSAERLVAHPAADLQANWSPDGRQVAFASNRRGNYDIWVTPSTGGQARPVTTDAAADDGPCWSPDGRWIVFVSNRAGSDDLWVVSASGGEPRQLTFHEADDWHPDWSPDGRWILFTSARNSLYGEVWRVPADGGEAELLTTGGYCPRYGPDGSKAYFKGSGERGDWIWEFSFFDRSQRPVMDIGGRGGTAVCWATDGQFLYLVWKESARGDIWVVDVL